MEHFFTSLSKRQTMLLLTAVTFGGSGSQASLDFLPEEEADLLKHRAQEMLQIPREKRIPLLVQEIKRLVNARRGQLWAADPEKLAEVLRNERPVLVEVLLKAFPSVLAEAVRAHLPKHHVRMSRDPRPEVLGLLRWKLEEVLARMGSPHAHFKFSDVLRLQSRELLTLVDSIGARSLGPALAGLLDEERDKLLGALMPDHRQLAQKASAQSLEAGRRLEEKDSKEALEPHGLSSAPAGVVRSAGVQRLARACLAQSSEFAALLLEKYPGEFGRLVARWVRDERARAVHRGDGGRAEFVHGMERLEELGLVTKPIRLSPPKPALPAPPGKVGPGQVPRGGGRAPDGGGRGPIVGGAAARSADARRGPGLPAPAPPRDWVAERNARRAGIPVPRREEAPGRGAPTSPKPSRRVDPTGPIPRGATEPPRSHASPSTTRPPALKRGATGHETSVARRPKGPGQNAEPVSGERPPGGRGDDER